MNSNFINFKVKGSASLKYGCDRHFFSPSTSKEVLHYILVRQTKLCSGSDINMNSSIAFVSVIYFMLVVGHVRVTQGSWLREELISQYKAVGREDRTRELLDIFLLKSRRHICHFHLNFWNLRLFI